MVVGACSLVDYDVSFSVDATTSVLVLASLVSVECQRPECVSVGRPVLRVMCSFAKNRLGVCDVTYSILQSRLVRMAGPVEWKQNIH